MGEDVVVQAVTLVLARVLVDGDTPKDDLVGRFFIVGTVVLTLDLDFVLFKLLDDFLDRVLEESLEGENLLSN